MLNGENQVKHTAPAISQEKSREDQLQFLRFLAFLNIFIAHAEQWLFFPYPASHSASAAVSFFFMLSGLVMGYSFFSRKLRLGWKEETRFMWKRIRKVYPLYFLTTLFMVIFSGIPAGFAAGNWAELLPSLTQLAKNLLLIQSWFPEHAHSFNSVGWFLSALMFSYACSLPFGWLLNQLSEKKRGYLLIFALLVGISFVVVAYCYLTQAWNRDFWHYQFPPARLGEFLIGMILGFTVRAVKQKVHFENKWKWIFTAFELFAIVFWFISLYRPGNYWRNMIVAWLLPNMLLLMVFALGQGWCSKLFRWHPLVRLGDVSFECYLVHQIVITRFMLNLFEGPVSQIGKVFSFIFCLVFSLMTAFFLHPKKSR